VVIQIAHSSCGLVCVCELCETEAFRPAGVLVEDEAEVQDCPDCAEDVDDLFLGETWSRESEKSRNVSRRLYGPYGMLPMKIVRPFFSADILHGKRCM
jgi:ribosome-binding protein aMBF1 (putative translation factor)